MVSFESFRDVRDCALIELHLHSGDSLPCYFDKARTNADWLRFYPDGAARSKGVARQIDYREIRAAATQFASVFVSGSHDPGHQYRDGDDKFEKRLAQLKLPPGFGAMGEYPEGSGCGDDEESIGNAGAIR